MTKNNEIIMEEIEEITITENIPYVEIVEEDVPYPEKEVKNALWKSFK